MTADKRLLKTRFAAHLDRYDTQAVVQDGICERLAETIGRICPPDATRCMEIGAGTGFLTRRLAGLFPDAQWYINDLVEASVRYIAAYTDGQRTEYLWGDAETVPYPDGLDLIASASALQWFDDPARFFRRAARALKTEGLLAFSTFGPENFRDVRAATGKGLRYRDRARLETMLLNAGFAVVETLEYTRSLRFAAPADVLRHIRSTGVNSIRPVQWTRRTLADFETAYRRASGSDDGSVALTYHPILIAARKR